jgi:hypothetical protein
LLSVKGRRSVRTIDGKQYIEEGDPEDIFADDFAITTECKNCGRVLIIPSKRLPYCDGIDAAGCPPGDESERFD